MLTLEKHKYEFRNSGIEILGDTPWGTHLCNFYETEEDILYMLVPFFKAGLENNEFCVYITGNSITRDDALYSLRKAIPDIDRYISENSIEIISYNDWYYRNGKFDYDLMNTYCNDKLNSAISRGYEGLRINGTTSWQEHDIWNYFIDYEKANHRFISDKRIIFLCTYPLKNCSAAHMLDIAHIHKTALIKQNGIWDILEIPELEGSRAYILKKNGQLKDRIVKGTLQLKEANYDLKNAIDENIITEEALQKSEANLFSIFNNTKTALILLDTDLNLLLFNEIANDRVRKNFGKSYRIGVNMLQFITTGRKGKMESDCRDALFGIEAEYETSYINEDNSICWYSVCIFPVIHDDDRVIGVCISSEDITGRKNAEIEKEKMTCDLIQRNKDLEQFSYMVSHNLRAPVANILGFSNMVIANNYDDEKKEIFVTQINRSALILDEVIRDLNLILQVKTEDNPRNENVKFSSIVDNIKTIIQSNIEKEKAVIKTDFSKAKTIKGNRVYLYSIFLNLITNSIKYHQPGVPPVIEIETRTSPGKLCIIFKDNGLGIDLNKNSDKVFGLYKRFHADIEGKGMGLFMVKTQVDILGGKIDIDSKVNKGTKFTIELNQ